MNNWAPVQTEFFTFKGGLDLMTTPIEVGAGRLLDTLNYEPDINGGYSRCQGYERFDGRPSPSAATYAAVPCTLTATIAPGDVVTCGASSGVYVYAITGGILLADPTGDYPRDSELRVNGGTVGFTSASVRPNDPITASVDAQYTIDAAAVRRARIGPVPGSGPVRSVWSLQGQVFAVRDNLAGTAGVIYRATSAGWAEVPLPRELGFTAGAALFLPGQTVKGNTSGATGIVRRVCLEAGAWGAAGAAAASGRLIIDTVAGNFSAGESLRSSVDAYAANRATSAAPLATQITLSPGGRYEWVNFNFEGQASALRAYCANGVDRAFEFDGTTVAPIRTGAAIDKPSFVTAVNNLLWLGMGSSGMYSVAGRPHCWDGTLFAGEIAFGDTVTAMQPLPGEALGVWTRNSTHAVVGAKYSDFKKQIIAPETGALRGTVSLLTDTYWMDDRGITSAFTSRNYGNFEHATVSRDIQPLINRLQNRGVASVTVRAKNQYRLICNDGRVLVMHVDGAETAGARRSFTLLQYLFEPSCACSVEDGNGRERLFAGSNDGYVYELERGSSFDGSAIEAFARIWYYNSRSPTQRKRYRRVTVELAAVQYAALRLYVDYSTGDQGIPTFLRDGIEVNGVGGVWEVDSWDAMFYDAQSYSSPTVSLTGTGTNLSLLFYSNTALDFGHRLQGALLHYSPRRLQR
jgi:hypothetical protein